MCIACCAETCERGAAPYEVVGIAQCHLLERALVAVGVMMMHSVSEIRWDDCTEGVPAFLIFAGIPFSNSIIGGIAVGITLYPFLKVCCGKIRELNWFTWLSAGFLILYLVLLNGK